MEQKSVDENSLKYKKQLVFDSIPLESIKISLFPKQLILRILQSKISYFSKHNLKNDLLFLDLIEQQYNEELLVKQNDCFYTLLNNLEIIQNNICMIYENESSKNKMESFLLHNNSKKDCFQYINSSNYCFSFDILQELISYNKQRKFSIPLFYQIMILKKLHKFPIINMFGSSISIENELTTNDMVALLNKYINTDGMIYLVPNEGNGGDALIALGTIHFFQKNNIKFKIIQNLSEINEGDILVYSGGGNLVSHYPHCEMFLKRFPQNKILILPHTIDKIDLLKTLGNNVSVITRELGSYFLCKKYFKHQTFLHKDMAFYLDVNKLDIVKPFSLKKEAMCFRNDVEKTICNIQNNIDISDHINYDRYMKDISLIIKTVTHILSYLNEFESIYTNRLHLCIAGYLLNKNVSLYPNSYWKNYEVYKYSPMCQVSNVEFVNNLKNV